MKLTEILFKLYNFYDHVQKSNRRKKEIKCLCLVFLQAVDHELDRDQRVFRI